MDKKYDIIDVLNEMDDQELVSIHNDYAERRRYYDDIILDKFTFEDELNYEMANTSALEFLEKYQDLDLSNPWFRFTVYGAESTWSIYEWIDTEDIAEYAEDNDYDFNIDKIREILDSEEDTDEN